MPNMTQGLSSYLNSLDRRLFDIMTDGRAKIKCSFYAEVFRLLIIKKKIKVKIALSLEKYIALMSTQVILHVVTGLEPGV